MTRNSFFGRSAVVKAMLASAKAPFIASGLERRLFPTFGPLAIGFFGWPLWLEARLVAREVFGFLEGKKGKLLDVGGSYGPYAFELARRGWEVTVIDIDRDNLALGETIRKSLGVSSVSFAYSDILSNGFQDNRFDAVLGIELIEHIKEDSRAVEEMGRVLKQGGVLVLATPHSSKVEEFEVPHLALSKSRGEIPEEVFAGGGHWRGGYNKESMTYLLESRGFSVEAVRYVRFPSILSKSAVLFPLTYPLALLASPLIRNRVGLVVKARKL